MVGCGVGDLGDDQITRARLADCGFARYVDEAIVGSTSRESCGRTVLATLPLGHEHLNLPTDEALALLPGDLLDQGGEPLVAVLHHRLGDLVVHRRGRRARSRGVLEGEGTGEARGTHDVEGALEVVLGLAGEAHDDVGRDCGLGHSRAHALDDAEVALRPIRAPHGLEDPVRP